MNTIYCLVLNRWKLNWGAQMLGNIWFSVRERVVVLQEDPAALYNAVLCTVGLEESSKVGFSVVEALEKLFCCV